MEYYRFRTISLRVPFWKANRTSRGRFKAIFVPVFVTGCIFVSLLGKNMLILGYFLYGLRYGLFFCRVTGQEKVEFWPFSLWFGMSPQNDLAKKVEKGRFLTISVSSRNKNVRKKNLVIFYSMSKLNFFDAV